jgi:hypothetical protein
MKSTNETVKFDPRKIDWSASTDAYHLLSAPVTRLSENSYESSVLNTFGLIVRQTFLPIVLQTRRAYLT